MRCKPGDIAVIIASELGNEGKLVEVLPEHDCGWWHVKALCNANSEFGLVKAGETGWCRDTSLRPLRDGPGEDETITWNPLHAYHA